MGDANGENSIDLGGKKSISSVLVETALELYDLGPLDADKKAVYCTDRKQHTRTVLFHLAANSDGAVQVLLTRGDHVVGKQPGEYRCRRPSCKQNVRVSPERWQVLYDGLVARGEPDCDISYLH